MSARPGDSETRATGASPLPVSDADRPHVHDRSTGIERIAVGVDGRAEGRDAACLAVMVAGVTGAELMLVAVDTAPPVAIPPKLDQAAMRERAGTVLRELRDLMAPEARTLVETDWSVPRALERVVRREQQDLLVVGSSRHAPDGRTRIGRRTRQLLGDAQCTLAVAPRGLCARGDQQLTTIGVGYDGEPEAREALRVGGALARAAGARLRIRAVLDDRLPYAWPPVAPSALYDERGEVQRMWDEFIAPQVESLREDAELAASATGAEVAVEVKPGSPPEELIALSQEVDLLVIGSRRWGTAARVLLGRTGEELMHNAGSSVMVVPRPSSTDSPLG